MSSVGRPLAFLEQIRGSSVTSSAQIALTKSQKVGTADLDNQWHPSIKSAVKYPKQHFLKCPKQRFYTLSEMLLLAFEGYLSESNFEQLYFLSESVWRYRG